MQRLQQHVNAYLSGCASDKLPSVLCSIRGLGGADLADVSARLAEQVEANMGMSMIYALVSAAQDWLREKVSMVCPIVQHCPSD